MPTSSGESDLYRFAIRPSFFPRRMLRDPNTNWHGSVLQTDGKKKQAFEWYECTLRKPAPF